MRIAEIFYSIQGEGILAGVPSVFIRTSGCNLRCVWCDTPYTSWRPEGKERSLDHIVAETQKYPGGHAVVTGGEPLLAPGIVELTERLKQKSYHLTIETAATIFKPVACDLASLSPKLSNSTPWKKKKGLFARKHERQRLNFPVIQRFIDGYEYQLKFVVEEKLDFDEIEQVLTKLKDANPERVLIMAQAKSKKELHERAPWIVEACKARGFRYSPRLHIELFGNKRGT
ncbi:MAG: 7-carboxy-7-deazaguanine synthase QueE [Deltaproteobacteria bacterium]|nr:7-carboxy-7-deazaguanine synthase QueE [Deltaproteobacteria bacterium]